MTIDLYTYSGEDIRFSKTLANKQTLTGHLKEDCSVTDPVIKVNYNASVATKTYAYISTFQRYYFITGITYSADGKYIYISMHVDVLMSYRTQILNCSARITRSQSNFDKYIPDELIVNTSDTSIQQRKLGTGFTRADMFYLLLGG